MSAHIDFSIIEKEIVKNTRDQVQRMDMLAQAFIVLNELPAKKIEEIGNIVGYVIACSARVLRQENAPTAWESLDAVDEDGKPIHQIQSTDEVDQLAQLEAELPVEIQELVDFLRSFLLCRQNRLVV